MTPYIFFVILLLSSPSWAADLTVEVRTQPGLPSAIEVAITGLNVFSPNDPKAVRATIPVGKSSVVIPGTAIDAAMPGTTWVCFTARREGTTAWFAESDGTFPCKPWPIGIIVVPPIDPPPIVPPPVEPPRDGFTKAEVLTLIDASASRVRTGVTTEVKAAIADNNALLADAFDVCLKKKQSLKTCVTNLRDALSEVSP